MMKKLKLTLAVLLVFTLTTATALAQSGGQRNNNQGNQQGQRQRMSYSERQEQRLTQLTKDLSLNEEQVTKAKALNTKYDKKFTELRNSATTPEERQAQRGKLREAMGEYDTEFKTILTDEQKVKYNKIQEERSQRFNRRGSGNNQRPQRGERPPQRD